MRRTPPKRSRISKRKLSVFRCSQGGSWAKLGGTIQRRTETAVTVPERLTTNALEVRRWLIAHHIATGATVPVDRLFHPRVGGSDKIARLTDAEFRVWFFYVLAADDFGVLPMLASKIGAADRTLGQRPSKAIDKALTTMVDISLVQRFAHQGESFLWSPTWQYHQNIRYPRREQTYYPPPPEPELEALDGKETSPTRELFATFHMKVSQPFRDKYGDPETIQKIAEREQKRSGKKPRRSDSVTGMDRRQDGSVSTHTRAGTRETANGLRPIAEFFEGETSDVNLATAPPLDVWARELVNLMDPQGRCKWNLVERPLWDALGHLDDDTFAAWAKLKDRLEQHKRSHRWRTGHVPRLDRWLSDGSYLQELPEEIASPEDSRMPSWARQ